MEGLFRIIQVDQCKAGHSVRSLTRGGRSQRSRETEGPVPAGSTREEEAISRGRQAASRK